MARFDYLLEKIANAEMRNEPFPYIYIEDFFSEEDFNEITAAQEINFKPVSNDNELFDQLFKHDYKVIHFPGCTTSQKDYLAWHKDKKNGKHTNNTACEGMGMTLRLQNAQTSILREIQEYMKTEEFNRVMAARFNVDLAECSVDNGIQKYLDGYEISPHPDVRKKALTFMININPHGNSSELEHHTHLLSFKPEYSYVPLFWQNNTNIERAWVPWSWCDSLVRQTPNNSIVIFSPSNITMHAVKADYDHLSAQRTQLYGNLWYKNRGKGVTDLATRTWEELDIVNGARAKPLTFKQRLRRALPSGLVNALDKATGRNTPDVVHRNYD